MRKQYHFWPAASGSGLLDAWDVDTLIAMSAQLPVEQVEVASITELDTYYWSDGTGSSRTIRQIVGNARLILAADLSYPVILGLTGGSWMACIASRALCLKASPRWPADDSPGRCRRTS